MKRMLIGSSAGAALGAMLALAGYALASANPDGAYRNSSTPAEQFRKDVVVLGLLGADVGLVAAVASGAVSNYRRWRGR